MNPIFKLLYWVLDATFWLIIISVIASWLVAFGVLNVRNQFVGRVWQAIHQMTDPLYRQVRRFIPTVFGGIDIAPVIVLFLIQFLQYTLFWLSTNYGL